MWRVESEQKYHLLYCLLFSGDYPSRLSSPSSARAGRPSILDAIEKTSVSRICAGAESVADSRERRGKRILLFSISGTPSGPALPHPPQATVDRLGRTLGRMEAEVDQRFPIPPVSQTAASSSAEVRAPSRSPVSAAPPLLPDASRSCIEALRPDMTLID